MKLLLFTAVLVVCMQMGWGKSTLEEEKMLNTDIEDRTFGIFGTGSTDTSVTIGNFGYIAMGAAILVPLIAGLALMLFLFRGDDSTGLSSYGSGYSSYDQRSYDQSIGQKFNPYGINWESLNILDYIAMGQEAWETFEPSNLECQKRLICEIHQNQSKLGGTAQTMVELFGYLSYAEILSLPDELKVLIEEYMDASEKGKTMQKDCGEVYTSCDFSVNGILNKFSTNEI